MFCQREGGGEDEFCDGGSVDARGGCEWDGAVSVYRVFGGVVDASGEELDQLKAVVVCVRGGKGFGGWFVRWRVIDLLWSIFRLFG